MKSLTLIPFCIALLSVLHLQSQHEIIIGEDNGSNQIIDFDDVFLSTDEGFQTSYWIDLDTNGIYDLGFWVAKDDDFGLREETQIVLQTNDSTSIAYTKRLGLTGPCDSLYHLMYWKENFPNRYSYNTAFKLDSTAFTEDVKIVQSIRYYDPCSYYGVWPWWLGYEDYIGFKKVTQTNKIVLGWVKINVSGYSEITIQEIGLGSNLKYGLYINEIMASNRSTIEDEYGEFDDWIELFNGTSDPINLSQFYMSNSPSNPEKWAFPDTVIQPNGFMIFWADNQSWQGSNHMNFVLDKDGGSLSIFSQSLRTIDLYTYHEQSSDISIGRYHNGEDNWVFFDVPTPGKSNGFTDVDELMVHEIKMFPNPAIQSRVYFSDYCDYQLYNIHGRLMDQGVQKKYIHTAYLSGGVYLVYINGKSPKKLIVH